MQSPGAAPRESKLKRPVVSDLDGTREGGLVFCVAMLAGLIAGAILLPGALTSFWVWCALLAVSAGLAWSVQTSIAHWTGHSEEADDD